MSSLELAFYVVGEYAPDHEVVFCGDLYGRIVVVGGHEPQAVAAGLELYFLEGELAVDEGHDDVAVVRLDGLVDDEQVAVVDAAAFH